MIIPYLSLDPDVLRNILESYICREGTDYGEHEWTLDDKVAQLQLQLARQQVFIVFDESDESVSVVTRDDTSVLGLL